MNACTFCGWANNVQMGKIYDPTWHTILAHIINDALIKMYMYGYDSRTIEYEWQITNFELCITFYNSIFGLKLILSLCFKQA